MLLFTSLHPEVQASVQVFVLLRLMAGHSRHSLYWHVTALIRTTIKWEREYISMHKPHLCQRQKFIAKLKLTLQPCCKISSVILKASALKGSILGVSRVSMASCFAFTSWFHNFCMSLTTCHDMSRHALPRRKHQRFVMVRLLRSMVWNLH